jgi:hypothetical protein
MPFHLQTTTRHEIKFKMALRSSLPTVQLCVQSHCSQPNPYNANFREIKLSHLRTDLVANGITDFLLVDKTSVLRRIPVIQILSNSSGSRSATSALQCVYCLQCIRPRVDGSSTDFVTDTGMPVINEQGPFKCRSYITY